MNKTVIVMNRICPFADRAIIALDEKKVDFEKKEVSLFEKEAFFTQTYKKAFGHDPLSDGKVPILIQNDFVLTESDLIVEYIEEKYKESGTKLIPSDPFLKIKMRRFNQNVGKIIGNFYGFANWHKKTAEQRQAHINKTHTNLKQFNDQLTLPYALGQQFTMADIMIFPWFQRFLVLKHYTNFEYDQKQNPKITEWFNLVSQRESIKKIKQPDEYFINGYSKYFASGEK